MEIYDLFYKWVPVWIRLPVLFILFFVILTANGIFLGNSTDISNDLGVNGEVYTQSFNALYIGMGLGLLFHLRLKMRFTGKSLLLYGLTCVGLLNLVCATTNSPTLFITACLLIGFTKITTLTEVYIIWILIWSKKMDTSRMYPFVYFTALTGLHFMTWFTSVLAYEYNWRYAYIWVLILVLLCIVFCLAFIQNNPLKRAVPLYQVDYIGLILLASSMMLVNYVAVNGRVEDWFNSKEIVISFWGAIVLFLLFMIREINIRRPLFDFRLFSRKTFRAGLFLFALLGFFSVGTFQSAFSAGTLHYEPAMNMELNLYLVPGILGGCIFCFCWYYWEQDADILFIAGFLSFVAYHWILYQSFSNEFTMADFWLPSLLKGFGTALIYISVGLYTTKKLPLPLLMTGAGAMILVRSFIGSGICGGLYNFWFYQQRVRHFDRLAGMTDAAGLPPGSPLNPADYFASLQQQASLAASKEITGWIIIGGLILSGSLTLRYVYQKYQAACR
jgi:hypothetical protein